MFYERQQDSDVIRCLLCPHACLLKNGETGKCGVRKNSGEEITLLTYGIISGYALDPVEKKPLYHFYPGKSILSAGSYGCNMKCDFCQNYHISQNTATSGSYRLLPAELAEGASRRENNIGIAYTYNEPLIWHEYVYDCAKLAASKGLKNVMVTNGYFNREPLKQLLEVIDAFNIDIKSFDDSFYRKYTGATLKPVLTSAVDVLNAGRHLEITTLIIPGLNDSEDMMKKEAGWIASSLGKKVPLHISRYFPMYKRTNPQTPVSTIENLFGIATEYLEFVYTGNLSSKECGSDTVCPSCHATVIVRSGYCTEVTGLNKEGRCIKCNEQILKYI